MFAGLHGASAADAVTFAGHEFEVEAAACQAPTPPPPHAQWQPRIDAARTNTRTSAAVSASGLEGTEPDVALDATHDPGLAKGARDLDLPPWSKGRYGSAIGRAVHAVLQTVDLATSARLDQAVAGHEQLVRQLAESGLASDIVKNATARQHWRETYVGTVQADGAVLEGYVDLVYREDDGALVIVDYKTDAVPSGAIASRVTYYKPQMDAYRTALAAATDARVSTMLLFRNPAGSATVHV